MIGVSSIFTAILAFRGAAVKPPVGDGARRAFSARLAEILAFLY